MRRCNLRHRGRGSFDRARAGIALARDLGFRTTVAATVAEDDRAEAEGLHALLDAEGVPPEDRLVRRVAQTGFADAGVRVGIDEVWTEPTLTADGAWWHSVGITDPSMQVASAPLPVVAVLAVIRATLNVSAVQRTHALQAFRCT